MTTSKHPERDSVPAVDKASEREPPSRSIPATALTSPTVIGEAPLASAPSEEPTNLGALFAEYEAAIYTDERAEGAALTETAATVRRLRNRLLTSLQSERLARETAERALEKVTYERRVLGEFLYVVSKFIDAETPGWLALRDTNEASFDRWHNLVNKTKATMNALRRSATPHPETRP